jgi:lipopolysaccharide export LptBFGC system permease protein LptF
MLAISVVVEQTIMVPAWLLSLVVSLLISILTAWGIIAGAKSNLEVRAKRNEDDIQTLQKDKVSRSEFHLICETLSRIEKKLDDHIDEA